MVTLQKFQNLVQLFTYFKDEQTCRNYLETIRWNGNITCPFEGCKHDKVHKFKDGKVYRCAKCKKDFSIKVGTIFEDSKISLQKWFACIYIVTSHKKGISSIQLGKDIGVTQKTAWYMLHRVRFTFGFNVNAEKLSGTCEADESFMGGAEANKHKHKRTEGTQGRSVKTKSAVAGVISRGGELRAKKINDTSAYNLRQFINKNVAFGSKLMTDEWGGYTGLAQAFQHKIVKHNEGEYVSGEAHTNTLEGFWSLLKRGVNGIYHSISAKHLQQYIDEFVFRYNTRNMTESYRFDSMLNHINIQLPYKQLIDAHDNRKVENQQGAFGF
jgi:transposase-like protein